MAVELCCPACHQPLKIEKDVLVCVACGSAYGNAGGIADFSGGRYYDNFESEELLHPEHRRGLEAEVEGSRWRIERFYAEKLQGAHSVLDVGCGNGVSVDVLNALGHDGWGIDLSALRKWQWQKRERRDRLAVASALDLPFADGSFDAVVSSGVIEHIGVAEEGGERYTVRPLPDRDALRARYMRELLRVTRPGGRIYVDCPNGAFPIDFWHNAVGGRGRWHRREEGFLPSFREIRQLVLGADPSATVRALSPHRRFAFRQVGRHWYGKVMALPMTLFFATVGSVLGASALNPYLVIEIRRATGSPAPR